LTLHPDGIAPHGGQLINRIATPAERQEFLDQADYLPRVQLDERLLSDLEMIAIGALSPLTGFMEKADYERVVTEMRLTNGLPWSIPITLSVPPDGAELLKEGEWVRLDDPQGRFVGVLELTAKYRYNRAHEACQVYGTDDLKHPGVRFYTTKVRSNSLDPSGCCIVTPILCFRHTKLTLLSLALSSKKRAGKQL
jgi:sulfate adenylyltransferase